jgi:hypothetical protein
MPFYLHHDAYRINCLMTKEEGLAYGKELAIMEESWRRVRAMFPESPNEILIVDRVDDSTRERQLALADVINSGPSQFELREEDLCPGGADK